jgi:hypothetical protein
MVLFSAKFIGQASSINHCALGFLLCILGSLEHTINFSLGSVDCTLKSTLSSELPGIDSAHFTTGNTSIIQLITKLAGGTVSSIKKSTALLNFTTESSSLSLRDTNSLSNCGAATGLFLEGLDGLTKLTLVALDSLETLSISLISMVKTNLQLVNVTLKLLLYAKSISLGTLLNLKGGKAAMAKMEGKIRELELELGGTQTRTTEAMKGFQRAERKVKELVFQTTEDKKNQDRMSELANKLQSKIKTYKLQIEEAEEIAALNLAKFRKSQQELEEANERGKLAVTAASHF